MSESFPVLLLVKWRLKMATKIIVLNEEKGKFVNQVFDRLVERGEVLKARQFRSDCYCLKLEEVIKLSEKYLMEKENIQIFQDLKDKIV